MMLAAFEHMATAATRTSNQTQVSQNLYEQARGKIDWALSQHEEELANLRADSEQKIEELWGELRLSRADVKISRGQFEAELEASRLKT